MSDGAIILSFAYFGIGTLTAIVQHDSDRCARIAICLGIWWPVFLVSYLFKGTIGAIGVMFFGDEA